MRSEAPSEKKLHRTMQARDAAEGAAKGGLVGAAAGALKGRSAAGAALGAAVGYGLGRLRGSERTLRDITGQERQQMRRDERTKKSEAEIMFDGFGDGLSKEAVAGLVAGLGSRVIGLGARASKAVGQGQAFGNAMRQGATALGGGKAGGQALARTVGAGTLAAGGLAAAGGAGYLAGRS